MKSTKIMPPTYMLIAMLLMIFLNFVLPIMTIIPNPWSLLGIIPVVLGVYVSVVTEKAFRDASTTVTPFEESSALVTDGWYRISRNPMYLGFVLVLVGIAVLLRSLSPFAVIPLFMAAIEIVFIKAEERMLSGKFGGLYLAYSKNTRRWI